MSTKLYYEQDYLDEKYIEFNTPRIKTVEEWILILNKELLENRKGFDIINTVFAKIYYSPNRTVFCSELEKELGIKGLNLRLGEFGKRIRKYSIVQFDEQISPKTNADRKWNIPFYTNEKLNNMTGKFSWVLRDELAEAMEIMKIVK